MPRDWDAATYDRVAAPQEAWGRAVLDRLLLRGDESVLDAGCGTGRVTRLLLERLPRGEVVAIDASPAMVERTRAALGERVDARAVDLLELVLDRPVDAILSTATFHWILDADRLYARLFSVLKPGGRLVAQCGGQGNVERFYDAVSAVGARSPFVEHLDGWRGPLRFSSPEETQRALAGAGFVDVQAWLEPSPVLPDQPRAYAESVCLGAHLERLPEALRDPFVDAVLADLPAPLELDYVRLNLAATRPRG